MTSPKGPTISVRPNIKDVAIISRYLRKSSGRKRTKLSHVIDDGLAMLVRSLIENDLADNMSVEEAYIELADLLPRSERGIKQLGHALRLSLHECVPTTQPPPTEPVSNEVLSRLEKAGVR